MLLDRRNFISYALAAGVLGTTGAPALARPQGFLRRYKLPLGVQIYAVDAMVRSDLQGTFNRLAAIGYTAIELAGLHGYTPQQLRSAADAANLVITGIHLRDSELGTTQADAERIAEELTVLGTRDAVLPMFLFPKDIARRQDEPFPAFLHRAVRQQGADLWRRTADFLNSRAAALAPHGVRLAYHNHNVEFEPLEGITGWQILEDRVDPNLVDFEIDLGWVAAAGLDPVAFVKRHAGRVRQVHVKDIKASTRPNFAFQQDPAEIGAGMLDWNALIPAAYRAGVRKFYVEQEPPFVTDRFTSLAQSYAFLAA